MRLIFTLSGACLLLAATHWAGAQQRPNLEAGSLVSITRPGVLLRTGPRQLGRHGVLNTADEAVVISTTGNWVQLQTADGREGWVKREYVRGLASEPTAPTETTAVSPAPVVSQKPAALTEARSSEKIAPPAKASAETKPATSQVPTSRPPAQHAGMAGAAVASIPPVPSTATTAAVPPARDGSAGKAAASTAGAPSSARHAPPAGALEAARPDPLAGARPTTAGTIGDGMRMVLVLLPVLALTLVGLRLLQRYQGRLAALPGLKQGLLGGLVAANARQTGGSSIRVLESVPLGGLGLHLVEVRGRQLLIASTAQQVTLLSELEPQKSPMEDDFVAVMNRARRDLGLPVAEDAEDSASSDNLEEALRAARKAIVRQGRRSSVA